jgi:hypothetical protein
MSVVLQYFVPRNFDALSDDKAAYLSVHHIQFHGSFKFVKRHLSQALEYSGAQLPCYPPHDDYRL